MLAPGSSIGDAHGERRPHLRGRLDLPGRDAVEPGRLHLGQRVALRIGRHRRSPAGRHGALPADHGLSDHARGGTPARESSPTSCRTPASSTRHSEYDSAGVFLTLRRNDVDFRTAGTARQSDRGRGGAQRARAHRRRRHGRGDQQRLRPVQRRRGARHRVDDGHRAPASRLEQLCRLADVHRREHGSARAADDPCRQVAGRADGGQSARAGRERDDRQGAWFSGVGGHTRFAGSNGDPSARVNDRGYAIGYDAAIGDHLIVGGSGGDTSPEVELAGVSDNSSSQMRHVGVYGRYARNASRLSVIGGGSHVESKTARWITDGFALSSANAHTTAARCSRASSTATRSRSAGV